MASSFPKKIRIIFSDGDEADIMQLTETTWVCPVCGGVLDEQPYGPTGAASYNGCNCCGVIFGYDDSQAAWKPSTPDEWRTWKKAGVLVSKTEGWKNARERWLQQIELTEKIRAQLGKIDVSI